MMPAPVTVMIFPAPMPPAVVPAMSAAVIARLGLSGGGVPQRQGAATQGDERRGRQRREPAAGHLGCLVRGTLHVVHVLILLAAPAPGDCLAGRRFIHPTGSGSDPGLPSSLVYRGLRRKRRKSGICLRLWSQVPLRPWSHQVGGNRRRSALILPNRKYHWLPTAALPGIRGS
jgi:hypothetical protein